jgi:predicted RNA-binding protein with RPS1 domain
VTIYCRNKEGAVKAQAMIAAIVEEPEVGKIYLGKVKRITDYGAFIEVLPGKEGLCHISKLSRTRVNSVYDVLEEGQEIRVKVTEIDKLGRVNLSHIDAVDPIEGEETSPPDGTEPARRPPPSRDHYDRGPRRRPGGGDRDRGRGGDRGRRRD